MTKNFKRIFSALLAMSMLLSFAVTGYAADESGEPSLPASTPISVSNASENAGGSASITFSTDNSYSFSSYTATVTYDTSVLTFIDADTDHAGELDYTETSPGRVSVTFTASSLQSGASGDLFTASFDISQAADADAKVSASGEGYFSNGSSMTLESGEGTVSITAAEYSVNFIISGTGSANAEKQTYKAGETVNITAIPGDGYEFKNWSTTSVRIENADKASTSFIMPSANVNINVYFKEIPTTPTNTITLTQVEGGTISSSVSSAASGENVTLTATPDAGYYFKEWSIVQGNASIFASKAPLTFLSMKGADVTVTAKFEKVPTGQFSLTIYSDNGKIVSGAHSYYTSGTEVRIKGDNSTEYYFDSWRCDDSSVTFANAKDIETTFVMPAKDTVIYAKYTNTPKPKYHLVIQVEGMGTAATSAGEYYFNEGDTVTVSAAPSLGFYFYGWSPVGSRVYFKNPQALTTTFTMPAYNVTIKAMFASNLLGGLGGTTSGSTSAGNAGAGTTVPTTPEGAYLVSFNTGGGTYIADVTVNAGQTVSRPTVTPQLSGYTFAGWYSDPSYTSQFNFSSPINSHTTIYAKWTNNSQQTTTTTQSFSDVKSTDWFYSYVTSLASKKIINGMGNNKFAPQNNITRAQFITILANLAGADLSAYNTSEFSDVKTSDWFAKQVAWAKAKGIAGGSNGKFSPTANISRQDMAVMIKRYADSVSRTLPSNSATTAFTDEASISSYAKDAVKAMQAAGIIGGKSGNRFDPLANATRAEASKMIYVLLSIIG